MSRNAEDFDGWIRSSFVEMNSELEARYFARPDRADVSGVGDASVYASDSVDASVSGVGDIDVYGEPADVKKDGGMFASITVH